MEQYHIESRRKGASYKQQQQQFDWTGHILRRNCILKQKYQRKDKSDGKMWEKAYAATGWT
jgi:hypothetical protein